MPQDLQDNKAFCKFEEVPVLYDYYREIKGVGCWTLGSCSCFLFDSHTLHFQKFMCMVLSGSFFFSCQLHGYLENEPLTLQLFIGTADDRLLRPHAFYQVHRITGKTVSTTSHEAILSNTKVLEIPLLPENNMRAM